MGQGQPADALLYDQNVLDWAIFGELSGDREYVGRGYVPSTRPLTEYEKVGWYRSNPGRVKIGPSALTSALVALRSHR